MRSVFTRNIFSTKICWFTVLEFSVLLVEGERPYGDPRRSGYYGHSDRRGIINKATKVFTREEYAAMLKALRDDKQDEDVPLLSFSEASTSQPG